MSTAMIQRKPRYYTSGASYLTEGLPKIRRMAHVAQAFTPSAPIDRWELFRGRTGQVQDVVSAVSQRGQHVALYGERGVGKTSLANVLEEIFRADDLPSFHAAKVNCGTEDTFESVWRNVFRELALEPPKDDPSPEDVRYLLSGLERPVLIIIDELDRLEDNASLTLLADTIKSLSDHIVPSTLVLVGVGRSIDDLIGEHASVERALVQVEMPRMSEGELREILENGFGRVGLKVATSAVRRIVSLSAGLPHYTHLLGNTAGQTAVANDRDQVTVGDVDEAIAQAVEKHSIRSEYQKATRSPRPDNLFPHVLLACALAKKDQLGFFPAGAVRDPLEVIARRRLEIPAFARHLAEFLEPGRGPALQREGVPRRYFYRFANPLLQPYVILNGLSAGLTTYDQVVLLRSGGL